MIWRFEIVIRTIGEMDGSYGRRVFPVVLDAAAVVVVAAAM